MSRSNHYRALRLEFRDLFNKWTKYAIAIRPSRLKHLRKLSKYKQRTLYGS